MKPSDHGSYFRRLLLTGLLIVGLGLIVGMLVKLVTTNNSLGNSAIAPLPTTEPSSPIQPLETIIKSTPSEIKQPDLITLNEFNQIQTGMTVKQVEEIIGTTGKLISSNQAGSSVSKLYSWQNQQGSNAIIDFRNDKVSSKAQSGLN